MWDWNVVGELVVGIAGGIAVGSWFASVFFENAALTVVTNPSVRKLANAADKMSGATGGGWGGVVSQLIERFAPAGGTGPNGRPLPPGAKVIYVDEQGNEL